MLVNKRYDIILCEKVRIMAPRYRWHRIKSGAGMSETLVSREISKSSVPWATWYQENFVSLIPGTEETREVP